MHLAKTILPLASTLILPALLVKPALQAPLPAKGEAPSPKAGPKTASLSRLPLHFEPNQGQVDEEIRFLSRGRGYMLSLTDDEAVFRLKRQPVPSRDCTDCTGKPDPAAAAEAEPSVLRMRLVGANPEPKAKGLQPLAGRSNYYVGDRSRWRSNVPHFGKVRYDDVYRGVDLVYYGREGELEYDFVVAPGADPKQIRLAIRGADSALVNAEGNLLLETPAGPVVQKAPVLYQEIGGKRRPVRGSYRLTKSREEGAYEVAFNVGAYDRKKALVIDPVVLLYSSFLGGTKEDRGNSIKVDSAGNIIVAGTTESADFPVKNPIRRFAGSWYDAYVTKLNPAGNGIVFSTYLGSNDWDEGNDLTLDADNNIYLGGQYEFRQAWAVKLSPTGTMIWNTTFGGSSSENAYGIAIDAQRNVYLTGTTDSRDMPVSATAVQKTKKAGLGSDAFVAKISATGTQLLYATYLGSDSLWSEEGNDIAVDKNGNAYVVGSCGGDGFPTSPNGFDRTYGGYTSDAFFVKLNSTASGVLYGTYLGGSDHDAAEAIAIDGNGVAYITGYTAFEFPTTANAYQKEWFPGDCDTSPTGFSACPDAFVTKINPAATGAASLVYSTFVGGEYRDYGEDIALEADGSVWIAGSTISPSFPTTGPVPGLSGIGVFLTHLNPTGSGLLFSTKWGGNSTDKGHAVALDGQGSVWVAGETWSTQYPTRTPLQGVNKGETDVFVMKFGPSPDDAPPTVTITVPAEGGKYLTLPTARGTASDPSGVLRVYVVLLQMNADGTQMTGAWNWETGQWMDQVYLEAYKIATGTTSWSQALPALPPGRYEFFAGAVDNSPAQNENPQYFGKAFSILASLGGKVTAGGAPLAGVKVTRTGSPTAVYTNTEGVYTFPGVEPGTYTLTPSKAGYYFTPTTRAVTVASTAVTDANFTATADTVAPVVKVTVPAPAPNNIYKAPITAKGTATDAGGVANVTVALARYTSPTSAPNGYYNWTTQAWDAAPSPASEKLAAGTANWSLALPALTDGFYGVRATATDLAGKKGVSPFVRFTLDRVVPTVAVTTPAPAPNNVYSSLTSAKGTAADAVSGVKQVRLTLMRFATAGSSTPNGYWNWTTRSWDTGPSAATEKLAAGTTAWSVALPAVQAGFYGVRPTAADAATNTKVGAVARFTIR